jgi:penicillin-binding protein 1C
VAVVVLENATGEWVAWEGSGDYFDRAHGGTINGPVTLRQPGSALKPFTYALAFEGGTSPATMLADIPSSFPTAEEGVVYSPRNYDNRYRGPLLARQALAGSVNVPAVALAAEIGVPNVLRFLRRAGLTTFDKTAAHYGLGLTLGNAEVRLDELTAAYSTFARGGEWLPPTFLRRPDGALTETTRIISGPHGVLDHRHPLGSGSPRVRLRPRRQSRIAVPRRGQDGHSQAYHDNWTIGYSRHATVGVWVGNLTGVRCATRAASPGRADLPRRDAGGGAARRCRGGDGRRRDRAPPSTAVEREVCAESGGTAHPWCPPGRREWWRPRQPDVPCAWHHLGDDGLAHLSAGAVPRGARSEGARWPVPAAAPDVALVSLGAAPPSRAARTTVSPRRASRSRARPTARPISSTRHCVASSRPCRCGRSRPARAASSGAWMGAWWRPQAPTPRWRGRSRRAPTWWRPATSAAARRAPR